MEIIRRNTDYALRAMIFLANEGRSVPARDIAELCGMPYQITAKLLQKLHKTGLVSSKMGPKGGFELSRGPEEIKVTEIVEVIQGPITVNKCTAGSEGCVRSGSCGLCRKLRELQRDVDGFLDGVSLLDFTIERAERAAK
ncbi:RrF2 family transcriptional regulator [Anaerohalosphaera lusitana]|uniref:RrF2 family transcriptional regulator n=1 Tax=Anaerohalosphaera lusitana TaxID=1936003 RepID=UPI001475CCAF|nr:Rrf2 family transcriptional regulator [Anaerohalosphaera lusitana]